ncbi:divalent-cation tolerance protein CutA [Synechococcus moorigangaii CMS01]|nr:divalent-cation tolerance protein CutA [Synechococcus moorigangaii CMS01]
MEYLLAITTVGSREAAQVLAKRIMARRLAACIHISEIESLYYWQGDLQQEPEFRLLCKTTVAQYSALEALIKIHHPYDLPSIYAIALDQIEANYGAWVKANISPESPKTEDY